MVERLEEGQVANYARYMYILEDVVILQFLQRPHETVIAQRAGNIVYKNSNSDTEERNHNFGNMSCKFWKCQLIKI